MSKISYNNNFKTVLFDYDGTMFNTEVMQQYVGNTKKVKAHAKDSEPSIPLINILEFSKDPKKHRPHVGKAVENSKDQIFDIIKSKVKEA